jgi:hypothetical protein
MSVRLVAKKADDDNYLVAIRGAAFGPESDKSSRAARVQEALKATRASQHEQATVCKTKLTPPEYPQVAARSGAAGNVYLLVKAGADGKVQDVIAEQVNLKVVANENGMERWRRTFAQAAILQARKWCIELPRDEATPDAFHVVRVPVIFHLDALTPYGQWEAYVPGPRQANPWQEEDEGKGFSPDTLAAGRAYIAGTGLKLLTELSGG